MNTQCIIQVGYPVNDEDMQRLADAAAKGFADLACLVRQSTVSGLYSYPIKTMVPLFDRTRPGNTDPAQLFIPGGGGAAGKVGSVSDVLLLVDVGPGSSAQRMAALMPAASLSPQIASNTSGSARTDAVYAQVQRAVTVTGTRQIKDAASGAVASQTVTLAKAPAVTVLVATGASVPADGAEVYNFPLCTVTVPNGYTAGTALTQDQVSHTWNPGALARGLLPRWDVSNPTAGAGITFASDCTDSRAGGGYRQAWELLISAGSSAWVKLDTATVHNISRRIVRLAVLIPGDGTAGYQYSFGSGNAIDTTFAEESGPRNTGEPGALTAAIWTSSTATFGTTGSVVFEFRNNGGDLEFRVTGTMPATSPFIVVVEAEFTPRIGAN